MNRLFDLRFVIGCFFTATGLLLLLYAFAGSEGSVINKACGAVFLLFGAVMLLLSYSRKNQDH